MISADETSIRNRRTWPVKDGTTMCASKVVRGKGHLESLTKTCSMNADADTNGRNYSANRKIEKSQVHDR